MQDHEFAFPRVYFGAGTTDRISKMSRPEVRERSRRVSVEPVTSMPASVKRGVRSSVVMPARVATVVSGWLGTSAVARLPGSPGAGRERTGRGRREGARGWQADRSGLF